MQADRRQTDLSGSVALETEACAAGASTGTAFLFGLAMPTTKVRMNKRPTKIANDSKIAFVNEDKGVGGVSRKYSSTDFKWSAADFLESGDVSKKNSRRETLASVLRDVMEFRSQRSIGRPGRALAGEEEPIPAFGVFGELGAAGQVIVPGVEHLAELNRGEAGLAEAVADFERLPKFLPKPLVVEAAEGEIVIMMFAMQGGVTFGGFGIVAAVEGLVHEKHGLIVEGVDRRDGADEDAAGTKGSPNRREGAVDHPDVGHDQRIDRDGEVEGVFQVVQLMHGPLQKGDVFRVVAESFFGSSEHSGGEVEREDAAESAGERRQERSGSATEVGGGFAGGVFDRLDRLDDRIFDSLAIRVEKDVVVTRRVAAPMLPLRFKLRVHGRRARSRTGHERTPEPVQSDLAASFNTLQRSVRARIVESPDRLRFRGRRSLKRFGRGTAGVFETSGDMTNPREKPVCRSIGRDPLVGLALAAMAGTAVDRWANPWGTSVWLWATAVWGLIGLTIGRGLVVKAVSFLAFATLAGAWHHARRFDLEPNDIARSAIEEGTPAWVRGVLIEPPTFRKDAGVRDAGITRTVLALSTIHDRGTFRRVSGKVALSVNGDRTDLSAGEPVEAAGKLSPIEGPLNPGENDPRDYWAAQDVRVRFSVDDPTGIKRDPGGRVWRLVGVLGAIREWSRKRLVACLDPKVAPLAAALLLGRREGVDPNVNDAFARTGTMHVLAISGLHMQALAIGLRFLGLALGIGRKRTWTVVLIATTGYALLVGLMPSVVRSAAMTAVICVGELIDLPSRRANVLAAAALATLVLNPSHLFDVGCQLSFVAVAAIYWGPDFLSRLVGLTPWIAYLNRRVRRATILAPFELNDPLIRLMPVGPARLVRRGLATIFAAVWVSTTVWLAAAPLTALRFHTLSPIGILLNIPLIPLTTLALFAAGAALLSSAIWTPLGIPAGRVCGKLLEWTERLTNSGVSVPFGHAFVPGPPALWVFGLFVFLAVAVRVESGFPKARIPIVVFLIVYLLFGVAAAGAFRRPKSLEVDVLAVGHGLAVVIEDSEGKTLLYDCGRMNDPRVGRRTIAPAIWSRGVRTIDAIVLSHADSDHYNGLPDLLDRFRIGAIHTPPGFFDDRLNPGMEGLRRRIEAAGVPLKTLVEGDRFSSADKAEIRALHPPKGWLNGIPDNARCVVLDIEGNGRHLLLTGDLEGIGLTRLIDRPRPGPIDAMLAPHHGGRTANPPYLYDWAEPKAAIVSQRRPIAGAKDPLAAQAARGVRVFRTWQAGAIRARLESTGFQISAYLEETRFDRKAYREAVGLMILSPGFSIAAAVGFFLIGLIWSAISAVREWAAWTLIVPSRNSARDAEDWDERWRPIETRASDGVVLRGWARAAEGGSRGGALLTHGLGEGPDALRARAVWLLEQGWDVVLADARGRGRSGGDCFSFGDREAGDVSAWVETIRKACDRTDAAVVLWGRSMGAAIAVRAAAERVPVQALVLESPYADLRRALARRLRFLPTWIADRFAGSIIRRADRLAKARIARPTPLESAREVGVPTLILHGRDDRVATIEDARALADAFRPPAALIEVEAAGHADVFDRLNESGRKRLAEFLENR